VAYIRQLEAIALFKVLDGDIIGASVARSNMGNAFEGKYWRYHIFFRQLLDYCVIFFFADYLIKRRGVCFLIFGGSFLVAGFSATMAIEKAPLANLLIMLYLTYVIYKAGDYWQPAAKYVLVLIISILSLFFIYFTRVPNITSAFQSIVSRVFTGQMTAAYFYLDLFPRHIDYLWGASFPNPGGLLPFQSYHLTVEVASFMFPEIFADGIVGTAPTVFWAEMYANFGSIGIILPSFLVGIGLFAVSHILSKLPLSPAVSAATVSLAMHYGTLTGTSLSNYLFDIKLLSIAAITFIVLLFRKRKSLIRADMQPTPVSKVHLYAK
jgi:hypothetical protein